MQSQILEISQIIRTLLECNSNKCEIILQLPQLNVIIQCDIAYPSELLRHVCATSSGHDRESHSVRCIDS